MQHESGHDRAFFVNNRLGHLTTRDSLSPTIDPNKDFWRRKNMATHIFRAYPAITEIERVETRLEISFVNNSC
jgi:hypothetical protein